MENTLIKCTNLKKLFFEKTILNDISIKIKKGDSIAIIGENGCGKSTLLKILCGLDTATSGNINVKNGLRISYIPDRFPKLNMTACQYVMNIGSIASDDKAHVLKRKNELFLEFHMEKYANVLLKFLSKGTLQKIAIIQAILIEPDILFMDEPLAGQDIESQYIFINAMKKMLDKQVCLIFVCHEKLLLDKLAKHVFLIENGKIHYQCTRKISNIQCVKVENNGITMPNEIKCKSNSIISSDELIKIYVEEESCNSLLSLLLNYNYKIKEVVYENN